MEIGRADPGHRAGEHSRADCASRLLPNIAHLLLFFMTGNIVPKLSIYRNIKLHPGYENTINPGAEPTS
jgi:hypothetical protein